MSRRRRARGGGGGGRDAPRGVTVRGIFLIARTVTLRRVGDFSDPANQSRKSAAPAHLIGQHSDNSVLGGGRPSVFISCVVGVDRARRRATATAPRESPRERPRSRHLAPRRVSLEPPPVRSSRRLVVRALPSLLLRSPPLAPMAANAAARSAPAALAGSRSSFAGSRKSLAPARSVRSAPRSVAVKAEVKEIHMPALSSTMTEGKIVSWLKGEGEAISKGDAVVVVESDKADMDVESFFDGYLAAIAVPDGEMATVGAPIAFVAETEAEIGRRRRRPPAPAAPPAAPAPRRRRARAAPAAEAPRPPRPRPRPPRPPPPPAAPGRADGRIIATPYARSSRRSTAWTSRPSPARASTAASPRATSGGRRPPSSSAPAAAPRRRPRRARGGAAGPSPAAAAPAPSPRRRARSAALADAGGGGEEHAPLPLRARVPHRDGMCTDELDALYKKVKPKGVTMTALLGKAVGVALAQHPIMFSSLTPAGDAIVYNEGEHRHRRRARIRAHHPRARRRRGHGRVRARARLERPREEGARPRPRARRLRRRQLHHLQHGHVRRGRVRRHPAPGAVLHPRRRRGASPRWCPWTA